MPLRDSFPIVYVREMGAALGFYRDLLGLTETYRRPEEGDPDGNPVSLGSK